MKNKLDVDFQKYVILGACNPQLAHRALGQELSVGLLLPCNVVVYEPSPGKSVVSIIDPKAMMEIASNPGLESIADEAYAKLQRVRDALAEG